MNNVPELRFPEFEGEWENNNLGSLCEIKTGNKDTKNKEENGIYPFFIRSQQIEKINSYSYDGEAILTAGDGVGVGKVFHYINGKFDYHQRVYMLSHFTNCNGKFIFYYFKENFIREAMKYNAKTSVDSVRRDMIYSMNIPLPTLQEQSKIANFFSLIDQKIEKQQEKVEGLEEWKKGLMQKIFNQDIRFKDDDGKEFPEWERIFIKEVGEVKTGKTPPTINKAYFNGQFMFVTPTDIKSKFTRRTDRKLSEEGLKKSSRVPANSLLVTCIASIGKNTIVKEVCSCNQQINYIVPFKSFDVEFLYYRISYDIPKIKGLAGDSATAIINKSTFENVKLEVPIINEQIKIGNFLSKFDQKIEKEKEKLEGLKEMKKGLMQKMFV